MKQIMVIAVDDSAPSMYALEWTLDHFFTPFGSLQPFQLIAVHARPVPISVIQLAGPGISHHAVTQVGFKKIYLNSVLLS